MEAGSKQNLKTWFAVVVIVAPAAADCIIPHLSGGLIQRHGQLPSFGECDPGWDVQL